MTSRIRHSYGLGAVCAAWLAGCDPYGNLTVSEADDDPTAAFRSGSSCPIWQCGFNAAEVHGAAIHELDLGGAANDAGLRILSVLPSPKGLAGGYNQLAVVGDELVLRRSDGVTLTGPDVVGTRLVLGQGDAPLATILVVAHDTVDRWSTDGGVAHAYALTYLADGVERNVCTGNDLPPRAAVALVLGGETYDMDAKTVEPDRPGWFTIACAGSAAAKLSLLGYGPQSSATTMKQRQATLKMITADYCGTGHSYTVNGTPILWENAPGTVPLAADPEALEAVWTGEGALCLESTRIAGMKVACELPACDDFDLADGEWISYIPQPVAT